MQEETYADEQAYHDNFYANEGRHMFDTAIFIESRRRVCRFLSKYGIYSSNNHVLSLGSGDGSLDIQMAPSVGKILGVELSETAVKEARERAKSAHIINLDFQVGDIQKLNFPPESFDVIWAPAVLHHLDDVLITDILQRSISWLKPGGVFISIDPSDRRFIGLFRGLFAEKYQRYHSPDERELNIKQLSENFRQAGFKDVNIHYIDYFLNPLAWLFPKFPKLFVPLMGVLDSLFLSVPVVQSFASSFSVVARKGIIPVEEKL